MELENAIKSLKEFAYTNYGTFSQKEAKLILQALDNSIPKEKIENTIQELQNKGKQLECGHFINSLDNINRAKELFIAREALKLLLEE